MPPNETQPFAVPMLLRPFSGFPELNSPRCDVNQRAEEEALLRNLRSRQSDLTALLETCSSHWGFEDPIYRFYHRSFKVYSVQDETVRIVRLLESLAPERR
jgi:hypothetical protein